MIPTHAPQSDRPRLRAPVIRRDADEVQVGIEAPAALIFRGLGWVELVSSLDGSRPRADLLGSALALGLAPTEVEDALRVLYEAGLVEDASRATAQRVPSHRVRLVGSGVIGRRLTELLLDSGEVQLFRYDPSEPVDRRATAGQSPPARFADEVGHLTTVSHWSKPESVAMNLTILVADGPECDRAVADHLVRRDEAHLVVGSLGRGVRVGPLVLPGRTCCVHCTDLTRSDKDPQWPTLLSQLRRLRLVPPPPLVSWAAAVAAAQAFAFLSGAIPEVAGATLELAAPDLTMRLRPWPAHPKCGCSWSGPTEWGP